MWHSQLADPDNGYRYLQLRGDRRDSEADPTGAFYQRLQLRYRGETSEVKDRTSASCLPFGPRGLKHV